MNLLGIEKSEPFTSIDILRDKEQKILTNIKNEKEVIIHKLHIIDAIKQRMLNANK
mgnify:CR=1 FL=1